MITREILISKVSEAIDNWLNERETVDSNQIATIALDTIMGEVATPLCSAVESVSPFGKLIADQIRQIAGKDD